MAQDDHDSDVDDTEFETPYKFKTDNVTVVLRHHADAYLRVKPKRGVDKVYTDGKFGAKARFLVNISKDGDDTIATFKSEKTGEYLRIGEKNGVNAGGNGGKLSKFKVHRISGYVFLFESVEYPGSFIGVNKDGDGVHVGKGGRLCRFNVLKEGKAPPFSRKYNFGKEEKQDTVVIEHRDMTTLRVKEGDTGNVDSDGGHGDYAQWTVKPSKVPNVVQFQSKKTGDYLRINKDNQVDASGKGGQYTYLRVYPVDDVNEVRLESQKLMGQFIELDSKNKTFVSGDGKGKTAIFCVWRE